MGIDQQITSPTFALSQSYTGRLDLYHLDVYRLEQVAETMDLGLSELLDEGAVTVIEWGDAIAPALPHDFLEVHLTQVDGEPDHRRVELVPIGPRWAARTRALATAIARWAEPVHDAGGPGAC